MHLSPDDEVVGFDVVDPKADYSFRTLDVLNEAVALDPADAVIYLSQSPHYRDFAERGDHLFGVNVVGGLRAAKAAADAGAKVFVYASTGSVYGPSFEPLDESSPVRRDDPYALSKITAEDALRLLPDDMRIVCVRLFGVFGPGQQTMLVPALTGRVRRGEAMSIDANPQDAADKGGLRISLTYVDDVVASLTDICRRGVAGEDVPQVLNVAAPEPVSIRDVGEAIGAKLGVEPVFEDSGRARVFDLIADVSRLQAFGAPDFTPFRAAIDRTLDA